MIAAETERSLFTKNIAECVLFLNIMNGESHLDGGITFLAALNKSPISNHLHSHGWTISTCQLSQTRVCLVRGRKPACRERGCADRGGTTTPTAISLQGNSANRSTTTTAALLHPPTSVYSLTNVRGSAQLLSHD